MRPHIVRGNRLCGQAKFGILTAALPEALSLERSVQIVPE
jgi:hypothetical protein